MSFRCSSWLDKRLADLFAHVELAFSSSQEGYEVNTPDEVNFYTVAATNVRKKMKFTLQIQFVMTSTFIKHSGIHWL